MPAARWPRSKFVLVAVLALVTSAQRAMAQDTTAVGASNPSARPLRFIVSGGMAVPMGGFSDYHDLGVTASASAVIRMVGQKVRLRPEVMASRWDVAQEKVRALVGASQVANGVAMSRAQAMGVRGGRALSIPKIPDLTKIRDGAISSLLAAFANVEVPLGPRGLQPYIIGGIGAVSFRTDVTTLNEAINGVQWGYNAGAGIRFRMGPLGGGLEARFRGIPVDQTKTFFKSVTAVPVTFSLVF